MCTIIETTKTKKKLKNLTYQNLFSPDLEENSPIIPNIKHSQTFRKILNIVRRYPLQKVYVFIRVEPAHVMHCSSVWFVNLKERQHMYS